MTEGKMIAVVGTGAILPDAFDVPTFWKNILDAKYSIRDLPEGRWDLRLYFDPDPKAIDKTYTKIGAFVEGYKFDPFKMGLIIPPKLLTTLDPVQQWTIAATHQAMTDYGYPNKPMDLDRVAVVFGNSNAGEYHYNSTFRIRLPEYQNYLAKNPAFAQLPADVQQSILKGVQDSVWNDHAVITEDTMPGELANIIPGRVANVFNFTGPNYVTDAACASSLAAISSACEGLLAHRYDVAFSGGSDRSMGVESYIKFCKIGALSVDGSRPYAEGANGFVMGEGTVVFMLKRLEDAERDNDKIYAVIRGFGGSSDGKGKGITAPNPLGQQKAIQRAWQNAEVNPADVGLIEGHGTSTKVGDVAEVNSLQAVFGGLGLKRSSVVLGSVKSNMGHLKSAAGAVGLLKTVLALHHKTLTPTANFRVPNPGIDFANMPFEVITSPREWEVNDGHYRFAGVSSFGFGGTNFHVVLEEYFPGVGGAGQKVYAVPETVRSVEAKTVAQPEAVTQSSGAAISVNNEEVKQYVLDVVSEKTGYPKEMLDMDLDLEADLGIDTVKQAELFATIRMHYGIPRKEDLRLSDYNTLTKVVGFVTDAGGAPAAAPATTSSTSQPASAAQSATQPVSTVKPYQGLYFASASTKDELKNKVTAALNTVQNGGTLESVVPSQTELQANERIAVDYATTDELPKKLERALSGFENDNAATWKALQAHGIYRGSGDPGKIAFLFPGQGSQYVNMMRDLFETEPLVKDTFAEADAAMMPVLGRALTSFIYTDGSEEELKNAEKELKNTQITQPAMLAANIAVMRVMHKYGLKPDFVIGHSLGEYAALVAAGVLSFADALQIVSARGREMTRLDAPDKGAMAAVSAPITRVEEVLKTIDGYVVIANINSPVQCVLGGETKAIDDAVAAFTKEGFQAVKIPVSHAFHTKIVAPAGIPLREEIAKRTIHEPQLTIIANVTGDVYPRTPAEITDILAQQVASPVQFVKSMKKLYDEGARVYIECGPKRVLSSIATDNLKDHNDVTVIPTNHPRKGGKASFNEALCAMYAAGIPRNGHTPAAGAVAMESVSAQAPVKSLGVGAVDVNGFPTLTGSVVMSGAGLGLPGKNREVFADSNIMDILNGQMRIEQIEQTIKEDILDKRITRLVKSDAGAVMEPITDVEDVIKLAGQSGKFDLVDDFGVPADRADSLDISSKLAIAAGIEALRDAGIPLVMAYKTTTKGTKLPDRWKLPESMQEETGVVFGSAFPGLNRIMEEQERFYNSKILESQMADLDATIDLVKSLSLKDGQKALESLEKRKAELSAKFDEEKFEFDRRFLFRILSMGHSQFAEYIGARGPNAHANAACATTTHAISIAEDWIRSGRCRRVIVVAGDDVTNRDTMSWVGTSLFASGAATTVGDVRMAALPFDRRRNGMLMGMGAAAIVLESEDAIRERGMKGIGEVLSTYTANSAYHGTRLDINHVSEAMNLVVTNAERRYGLKRSEMAAKTMFVSHETYTPARGGSASAEIHALRYTFGAEADKVIVANTKGFTGHSMGVGIEDVVAVKALETGIVPPIAHIGEGFEPDPDLGNLNLSKGGVYNPQYALRLGAGFGSQIALSLVRRIVGTKERVNQSVYNQWLASVSGYASPEVEVVKRTYRIKNTGVPQNAPAKQNWVYGQVPLQWAISAPNGMVEVKAAKPAPMTQPAVSAPVQPQAAAVAATALSSLGGDTESIKKYVLEVVSEKTGYPQDMLDLGLDLEADLGIDTVKQAELFAAIRTHYGIPRKENLILADYNTLEKVIGFVRDNSGQPVSAPAAAAALAVQAPVEAKTAPVAAVSGDDSDIKDYVISVVSEKTGYPAEMLDLELDLEADLGIDTVKQAELFAAIRTHYGIPRKENLILADYNTLTKVIGFVRDNRNGSTAAPATAPAVVAAQVAPAVQESTLVVESSAADGSIKDYVLETVSEKTGYPKDMLDMDLDLEADLGIDTVKQAELFATIRTHYGIPRQADLILADYNTLNKVVGFIQKGLQATAGETPAPTPKVDEVAEVAKTVEAAKPKLVLKQPVPVVLARADFYQPVYESLEGKSVLVVGGSKNLVKAVKQALEKVNAKVQTVAEDKIEDSVSKALAAGTVDGVVLLTGLAKSGNPEKAAEWTALTDKVVTTLYHSLKDLPQSAFVVAATNMGGLHGLIGGVNPAGGLVSGFVKALGREHPGQFVKVVDFEAKVSDAEVAKNLVDEVLHDSTNVEIGYHGGLRYGVDIQAVDANAENTVTLDDSTVYVVTGGTAGIIEPIVRDLASNRKGTYYLLGRTNLLPRESEKLQLLATDRNSLKTVIQKELKDAGEKATPVVIDQKIGVLEKVQNVYQLIETAAKAGAKVVYIPCDVTDPVSVGEAVKQIKAEAGRVDVVLHAAGVDKSRKLDSKSFEEVRGIVRTKVDGLHNLQEALRNAGLNPSSYVLFSSVAGRYGNAGQADYAAANDHLSKLASALSADGVTRAVSIDWGAWAEVGMASRGTVPMMMERAGIEMLAPEVAAPVVREVIEAGLTGEVIAAGKLGLLDQPCADGCGVDLVKADEALRADESVHRMFSHIAAYTPKDGLKLEAELDPERDSYLQDHAINGIPVLPGVMGIEGFARAAKHIASVLASRGKGFEVVRLGDIKFLAPVKFYGNKPRKIQWTAKGYATEDGIKVTATLESDLLRANGESDHVTHFTGNVYLSENAKPEETLALAPKWAKKASLKQDNIYKLYFHGPSFQVLDSAQLSKEGILGRFNKQLAEHAKLNQPETHPLLVELCFQTAGLYELGKTGGMGLPHSIESIRLYNQQLNGVPVYALVTPVEADGQLYFNATVVDAEGNIYLEIERYLTNALPYSLDAELLRPVQNLFA